MPRTLHVSEASGVEGGERLDGRLALNLNQRGFDSQKLEDERVLHPVEPIARPSESS